MSLALLMKVGHHLGRDTNKGINGTNQHKQSTKGGPGLEVNISNDWYYHDFSASQKNTNQKIEHKPGKTSQTDTTVPQTKSLFLTVVSVPNS